MERQVSAFDFIALDMPDAEAGVGFITNLNVSNFPADSTPPVREVVAGDLENLETALEAEVLGVEELPVAGVPAIRASPHTRAIHFHLLQTLWVFRTGGASRLDPLWYKAEWLRRGDKEPAFDRDRRELPPARPSRRCEPGSCANAMQPAR
ncbi:hypothetical protein HRbin29_01634 [bacterium HR29]|nr:hypothetical protein HRbin29_01634 [bacterium HR29]